jgi:putative tryptophan/tyrosine transport system substrate-binding protein
MNRRAFVTGVGAVLAAPLAAEARELGKIWRIGYLTPSRAIVRPTLEAALRERGYLQGKTITIELRGADNDLNRLSLLAADLVRSKVDVIVAVSQSAILAARNSTPTIPIVMAFGGEGSVAEAGIVQSFANPGGNITGVYLPAQELDAKRLELLLQAVPNARTVGVLYPEKGWSYLRVRQVAQANGVHLHVTDIPGPNGYEHVFDTMVKAHVDALLVPSSPRFSRERPAIIDAAAKRHIPAVYEWGDMARAGGLLAYGPTFTELDRQVATFIDKILKGAKPGDLPIEQPTKFELVINMKTAKALGLTIPPSLMLRADQVIE